MKKNFFKLVWRSIADRYAYKCVTVQYSIISCKKISSQNSCIMWTAVIKMSRSLALCSTNFQDLNECMLSWLRHKGTIFRMHKISSFPLCFAIPLPVYIKLSILPNDLVFLFSLSVAYFNSLGKLPCQSHHYFYPCSANLKVVQVGSIKVWKGSQIFHKICSEKLGFTVVKLSPQNPHLFFNI